MRNLHSLPVRPALTRSEKKGRLKNEKVTKKRKKNCGKKARSGKKGSQGLQETRKAGQVMRKFVTLDHKILRGGVKMKEKLDSTKAVIKNMFPITGWNKSRLTIKITDNGLEISYSLLQELLGIDGLIYNPEMTQAMNKFSTDIDGCLPDLSRIEDWLKQELGLEDIHNINRDYYESGWFGWTNTYNFETLANHGMQYCSFRYNGMLYHAIAIHNGGDIRGNYGCYYIFSDAYDNGLDIEWDIIFYDAPQLEITSQTTLDDVYKWLYECHINAGRFEEGYTIEEIRELFNRPEIEIIDDRE